MMNMTGLFKDTSTNLMYFNYTSAEPISKNGLYFLNLYHIET